MHPVQLFHWHFMAYPYLPEDFDERFDTGWVTVPNSLWDRERTDGLYQEYIDQLAEAARARLRRGWCSTSTTRTFMG